MSANYISYKRLHKYIITLNEWVHRRGYQKIYTKALKPTSPGKAYSPTDKVIMQWMEQRQDLAEEAVGLIAELTLKLVDVILVDAPAGTVRSLAVKAVLTARFRNAQSQLQKLLVLFPRQQLKHHTYNTSPLKQHMQNFIQTQFRFLSFGF